MTLEQETNECNELEYMYGYCYVNGHDFDYTTSEHLCNTCGLTRYVNLDDPTLVVFEEETLS